MAKYIYSRNPRLQLRLVSRASEELKAIKLPVEFLATFANSKYGKVVKLQLDQPDIRLRVVKASKANGKAFFIASFPTIAHMRRRWCGFLWNGNIPTAHFMTSCLLIAVLFQSGERLKASDLDWYMWRLGEAIRLKAKA